MLPSHANEENASNYEVKHFVLKIEHPHRMSFHTFYFKLLLV